MHGQALVVGVIVCFLVALPLCAGEDTRIADAAQRGDAAAVRTLLKQKAAVNGKQGDGSTALHWAAHNDDLPLTQLLLSSGADPKAETRIGRLTPLSMAAENGSVPVAELLLKAGATASEANSDGTTVLMTAAASGSVELAKLLLDHGADPNAREKTYGQTPLMFAAALNRAPVIRLLLARGADPNIATHFTKFERIRLDVDGNAIPPEDGKRQPKTTEAKNTEPKASDTKSAELKTTEPSKTNAPAIIGSTVATAPPAAKDLNDQIAELKALVQTLNKRLEGLEKTSSGNVAGGPSNAPEGDTTNRSKDGKAGDLVFQGPREVGATVIGGISALLLAAREGHLQAARELVEGGANLNQVAASDRTSPLVMAIINGHLDLAKWFIERGAATNFATTAGLTPLIATIDVQWAPHAWFPQPNLTQEKTSYLEVVKLLLAHGANPNARLLKKLWFRGLSQDPTWVDVAGATAFWRAAQATDVEAMRLLVAGGADPHIPNFTGDTPLMVASGVGWMANHTSNATEHWLEAVKYCVELGEDVTAADSRGYTSLHGAAYVGNNQMVLYLLDRGAKIDAKTKAGDTVADMANGPSRFGLPHPETLALVEKLGSVNSHNCRSDQCIPAAKEEKSKGIKASPDAGSTAFTPESVKRPDRQ